MLILQQDVKKLFDEHLARLGNPPVAPGYRDGAA
jgi:hypothetical protein